MCFCDLQVIIISVGGDKLNKWRIWCGKFLNAFTKKSENLVAELSFRLQAMKRYGWAKAQGRDVTIVV